MLGGFFIFGPGSHLGSHFGSHFAFPELRRCCFHRGALLVETDRAVVLGHLVGDVVGQRLPRHLIDAGLPQQVVEEVSEPVRRDPLVDVHFFGGALDGVHER